MKWFSRLVPHNQRPKLPVRSPRFLLPLSIAMGLVMSLPVQAELTRRSPDQSVHFYPVEVVDVKASHDCSVYVPAYSYIFLSENSQVPLAVTLSVRNIDPEKRLIIKSVEYFDTTGKKLNSLMKGWFALAPMATASFVIDQQDMSGGAGANFIVHWATDENAQEPLIETVMAGYRGTKGLSFSSRGVKMRPCV